MNFVLTPSLEHRTLTEIAIALWSREDIGDYVKKSFRLSIENWKEIEAAVIEKSSELPLPKILKEKLISFIVPVGLQILSWIEFHQHRNSFVTDLPATLFWTSMGTIDAKRTAEVLVKDESLSVHGRFQLACIYCLEDEIRDLWETFSLYERGYTRPTRFSQPLVSFWSIYLEEEWNQLRIYASTLTPYEYAFKESARTGNDTATRYFFEKLNLEGKDDFIVETAKCVASWVINGYTDFTAVHCSGVLLFLLSTMDAQQQTEVFRSNTYGVLKCLRVWPWQSLFINILEANWNFLSEADYHELLECIIYSMDYKHNLHKLFGEIWRQSPETYKQHVVDGYGFEFLLEGLCEKEDVSNIQLVFKDSSISARKKLMFGDVGQKIFKCLICREKWDLVEFSIQECISSREEMIKFRDRSRDFYLVNEFPNESQRDRFFNLVQDCIRGYNKRKRMEGHNT